MRKLLTVFFAWVLALTGAVTLYTLGDGSALAVASLGQSVDPTAGLVAFAFGGLVVNRAAVQAMFEGFNVLFNGAFTGAGADWTKFGMKVNSTGAGETYGWLRQLPGIREWIGDRVIHALANEAQTLINKDLESTVSVRRNDIEDDKLGVYSPVIAEMGRAAAVYPMEALVGLLKEGESRLCFDGQNFFDTDHPVVGNDGTTTTVANTAGGSGTPWYLLDCKRAVKPLVWQERQAFRPTYMIDETDEAVFMRKEFRYGIDGRGVAGYGLWQLAYHSKQTLDATNFETARSAMMAFKGEGGRSLGISPTHLVVPPSLAGAARRLINAETLTGGGANVWYHAVEVVDLPWLA